MGRIDRSEGNLFPWPKGAYIRNKRYLYINVGNKYVSPSEKQGKASRGYTGHDSLCIGVLQDPEHPETRKFYANRNYLLRQSPAELPDPPKFAGSISVGLTTWIREAASKSGLADDLAKAFGEDDTRLIMDMAAYMLSRGSAVMQRFPAWARDHELFSEDIPDESSLGLFLKSHLTLPKIKKFLDCWCLRNIGDSGIFLCYDSVNANCPAEGVFIAPEEPAEDNSRDNAARYDSVLNQVNADYAVRQSDGLPLTYLSSPGSGNGIDPASEILRFISEIKQLSETDGAQKDVKLCLLCDRGYLSENNLKELDSAGLEYIIMIRPSFRKYNELADAVIAKIRSYKNELRNSDYEDEDDDERYGLTAVSELYDNGPACKAHIIWSARRYSAKRKRVAARIEEERAALDRFISENKDKALKESELKWVPAYFDLTVTEGNEASKTAEPKSRSAQTGTKTAAARTVTITGYADNEAGINCQYQKAGLTILVTRSAITVQEANDAFAKRDFVKKAFQALKSHYGMDRIGVTAEEAMHGKGLIWFVASILHALLFTGTEDLRSRDCKSYAVPALIDKMEAIKADLNSATGKRERRFKLTGQQQDILRLWQIDEAFIDDRIASISE